MGPLIHQFDWHRNTETGNFFHLNFTVNAEEMESPTLKVGFIFSPWSHSSLLTFHYAIPPTHIRFFIKCGKQVLHNVIDMLNVLLKLTINIILLEVKEFLVKLFPILLPSIQIDIVDSTSADFPPICEVFFKRTHNNSSRHHRVKFISCWKVTGQSLNNPFIGIFFDFLNDLVKEKIPLLLHQQGLFNWSGNLLNN